MKTKDELQEIKKQCEDLSKKLKDLSDEELNYVTGGSVTGANVVGYEPPHEHNVMGFNSGKEEN